MPVLRPQTARSAKQRLFDRSALVVLGCLGIAFGVWEAYQCAKVAFGYVASYNFVAAIVVAIVLTIVGLLLAVYWRSRWIGVGFVLAGVLSCATFYSGVTVLLKSDHVAWRHEPPMVTFGPDQKASAVIYFCPKTTNEQIENFVDSVLEDSAEPRHAGRDFPVFVASYFRLSPSQANGHDGAALTFRLATTSGDIRSYITKIESDIRVSKVFVDAVPASIRLNKNDADRKCR
jgi:energy-coupling factor transporter transmembrane protein EcfT